MTDNGSREPDLLFYEVIPEKTSEYFGSKCMDWNNVVEGDGIYQLPDECEDDSKNPNKAEQRGNGGKMTRL